MIKVRYLFPLTVLLSLGIALANLAEPKPDPSLDILELPLTTLTPESLPRVVTLPSYPGIIPNLPEPELPNLLEEVAEIDTRLVLKLKERKVYVYQGEQELASYPVAIGKKGWETPTGNFEIIQLVKDPIWQNPWNNNIIPAGTKNPLGERWIGFWTDGKNSIGFHGTTAENLIGQAVSHGCVRMRNRDIKEMFEKVKLGTPVVVVP